jgi:aquaporin Z
MFGYSSPIDYTWKALLAEFIGTFAFVFILASAITVAESGTEVLTGTVLAALGGTFALLAMFYLFQWFSGAHFNPVTSIAMWVAGRMNFLLMIGYVIVQLLGAIAAAALVSYIFGGLSAENGIGSLTNSNAWMAVLVEAFLTFFFVLVVLFVTSNPILAAISGVAIGVAYGAMMLAGYSLTGASLNPARSLGTGIFSNNLGSYWIYVLGPLIGAIVAGLVYRLFMSDFSCCVLKDDCGKPVLDSCGNPIKVCKRPCINECGQIVKDECGKIQYEEYHKREPNINHMQQTPLGIFNETLSKYGFSPIHYMMKAEKMADNLAEKKEEIAHVAEHIKEGVADRVEVVLDQSERELSNFAPINLRGTLGSLVR